MSGDQRVALVTGANRGIGAAAAAQLARLGYAVVLAARGSGRAEETAASLDPGTGRLLPMRLDVTDQAEVDAARRRVETELGRIDALVNNAGAFYDTFENAVDADLHVVEQAWQVNCLGAWRMAKAFLPMMRTARYGRIVNVSSGAGAFGEAGGGVPAYRVSKAALNMLTHTLAAELEDSGVLVNAVCPGWVRTGMGGASAPRSPDEGADTLVWAATLPAGGPTGGFFRDRRRIPW
ncbi:MAG TPA: SDR family NAD(P)-dependent oxidoreductase [Candidatus Dormibacteraeota bacterium]